MVAKISVGGSLYGSLAYNTRKVDKEVAKVLGANKIFAPIDGHLSLMECVKDFEDYIPSHHKISQPMIHISLNPHPDDRLTDEKYLELAEEYLKRMGYGDQPYIIFKHEDISRHHLHIISLRVDTQGRKINDSFEHRRSMKITRDLEREFGLIPSGEKRRDIREDQGDRVDATRGNVRDQIASRVLSLSSKYNFLSFNEYRALLSLYNISVEEVKGDVNGKSYVGVVYSATDDNGRKIGNPFNSSEFGKSVGYDALQRKFERSKSQIRANKLVSKCKSQVSNALHRSGDREQFREELSKRGIDVVFRENDAGRLYGVTYIDHSNHCVLNGSRLGKELSANAISEWFENPHPTMPREEQNERWQHENHSPREPFEPLSEDRSQSHDNDESLSIGSLFDLPFDSGGYDDTEDENIANAIQKRKKKKQKRIKF
ncbi:MAG: conjugal transfer protein MobB [Rikenellaceae bacterium]